MVIGATGENFLNTFSYIFRQFFVTFGKDYKWGKIFKMGNFSPFGGGSGNPAFYVRSPRKHFFTTPLKYVTVAKNPRSFRLSQIELNSIMKHEE